MKTVRKLISVMLVLIMLLMDANAAVLAEGVLTMPAALTVIEAESFYGDTSIDKVILPDRVKEIRERAFADSSLSEINLPDSLTFIAEDAFDGPEKVSVTVNPGTYAYEWAVKHHYIGDQAARVTVKCSAKAAALGESVTWTAECIQGTGAYEYLFDLYRDGKRVAAGAYSADNTYKYSFTKAGTYYVSVSAKDGNGEVIETKSAEIVVTKEATGTEEEAREGGYVRLAAGTVVYTTEKLKEKLGKINKAAVVYAEKTKSAKAYKVQFDTESGSVYEGYVASKGIEFLTEKPAELADGRAYHGFLISVVAFTSKVKELTDGLWVYKVVDGYATVLGYLDDAVKTLSVPDQLGGYFVNAIGGKAFVRNTALSSIYIHGNVISIAKDAFAKKNVLLKGYNGTAVLAWAQANKYAYENMTSNPYFDFQSQVIDYTYADTSRYEYVNEGALKMRPAEAAQLAVGSVFYEPIVFGNLAIIYKVTGLQAQDDWVYISVQEATPQESLNSFHYLDDNMRADWSRAEWAPGVTVKEEKLGFNNEHSVTITPKLLEIELSKHLSFFVEVGLDITGHAELDYDIHLFAENELKKAEFYINPSISLSAGLRLEGEKKFDKATKKAAQDILKELNGKKEKGEIYICKVPVVSVIKLVELCVGVYIKVEATGEIKVVIKGEGKLGTRWNPATKSWEGINTWSATPPTLSGVVNLRIGPAISLEVDAAILGKLCSVEIFAGVEIEFTADWTFSGGTSSHDYGNDTDAQARSSDAVCFNLKVDLIVSLKAKLDHEMFKKVITAKNGLEIELVALRMKLKEWHWELGKGLVDTCSYDNKVRVNFNPGTGESVDSQVVLPGSKLIQPKLNKTNGTLKGWYIQQGSALSKKAWDFEKDTAKNNMTLRAVWVMPEGYHTVTFKCNYDHDDFQQIGKAGDRLKEPDKLKRMHYRFEGWYKDSALTEAWDFNSDIMPDKDITLYAKWTKDDEYDPFEDDYASSHQGERFFSGNGHSYTHIMEYKSYQEAVAHATRLGGYLATINSAAEQEFLRNYLYNDCAQTYLWLGMVSQDNWEHWATGEKVTYKNWASPPTSSSTQYNAVLIRSSGQWTTLSNSSTAHYVIEWGAPDRDADYGKKEDLPDVQYTSDENQQASYVTGLNNIDAEDIVIDGWYNGFEVKGIVANAFEGASSLKHVTIPATVTSIGNNAFKNCTNLEEISLTNAVTQMGTNVFQNCTSLTKVRWSAGLNTIPAYTFHGDSSLKTITNTDSVTAVKEYAFYNCTQLTNGIPAHVVTIDGYAYYHNDGLTEIRLPDSVTFIGNYAFEYCVNAKTIVISEHMTNIPYGAFNGCSAAETINIPDGITSIGNYAFNGVNGKFNVYANSAADAWVDANGKTKGSINGQYRVSFSVGIPNGGSNENPVVNDAYVRYGKRVPEPKVSVEGKTLSGWYLDAGFSKQWSFTKDTMPKHNITLYAKWVDSTDMFSYDVSEGKATVTGYHGNVESLVIPSKLGGYLVTKLAEYSIVSNTITSLTIPGTVRSIAGGAINCPNLYEVRYTGNSNYEVHPDGVLYNKTGTYLIYAPQGRSYMTYDVPEGVTRIYKRAFADQETLEKVTIPDTVKTIYGDSFSGNHTLKIYGSEASSSASYVFAHKYGFPYNLYTVFYNYDGAVVYTANIETGKLITDYYEPTDEFSKFGGWFMDEELTEEWDFDSDRMPGYDINLYLKWTTKFGVNVENDEITITGYQGSSKNIIIPEQLNGYPVTGIAAKALTKSTITSVTIPACVTTIASGAIGKNVKVIGDDETEAKAYAQKNGLTFEKRKYTIHFDSAGGSAVADIKVAAGSKPKLLKPVRSNYAFMGWYEDTTYSKDVEWTSSSIMVAHDVTLYAFWKSVNTNISNDFSYAILADGTIEVTGYSGNKVALTIPSKINGYKVSRIGAYAFSGNSTVLTVTIPTTVTSIGSYAFANSEVQTVSGAKYVTEIGECAFMNAGALKSVYISSAVQEIGESAFMYCRSLVSVTLRKGLETIGDKAFYGCSFLNSVSVPQTVTSLGRDAFGMCPELTAVNVPSHLRNIASSAFDSTAAITYVDSATVTILKIAEGGGTNLNLTWNEVEDAASYRVYRKREADSAFKRIASYTETTATISGNASGTTIKFYVQALDEDGNVISRSETVSYYKSALAQPSVKSMVPKDASSAEMRLNTVADATAYEVFRASAAEGPFTKLKTVTSSRFMNTGLVPGRDYYYKVRAYQKTSSGTVYSNDSDVFFFHMPYKFLTAPENVTVTQVSASEAVVAWDVVEDAEGYIVYQSINGKTYKMLQETRDLELKVSKLSADQEAAYKVAAYFIDGKQYKGPSSSPVSLTVKTVAMPVMTGITQTKAGTLKISWTKVDSAKYILYRSVDGGAYVKLKSITTTSYSDTTVEAGKTYAYRARAYVTTSGTTQYSNYANPMEYTVMEVPAVTGVAATQTSGTAVQVTWTSLSGVSGYEVWVSANNENKYELASETTATKVTLTMLKDGMTYYVKVRAKLNKKPDTVFGAFSESVMTTILGTPVIEVCEQEGATSVQVMWSKVTDVNGYELWRKAAGESDYTLVRTQASASYLNSGLKPSTVYSYKVRAYRTVNKTRVYSQYSKVSVVRLLALPSISSITRESGSTVMVKWGKVTNAEGYYLYMSQVKDGVFTKYKTVTTTSCEVKKLKSGETYYFKVVPYCTVDGVRKTGRESVAKGIIMLARPVVTKVEKTGDKRLTITWDAVKGASSYTVSIGKSADKLTTVKTASGQQLSFTDLKENTRYYYQVVANAKVQDIPSKSQASKTGNFYLSNLAQTAITKFEQPSETSVKITWKKISGASGYEVYRSETADGNYSILKRVTETTYTDKALTRGRTYYYKVRAYKTIEKERVYSRFSAQADAKPVYAVTITKAELIGKKTVALAWNSVQGAVSYRIYRSVNGASYESLRTVTTTSYNDATCKGGNRYTYKIYPMLKSKVTQYGPAAVTAKILVAGLDTVKITKCAQTNAGTVTLTWKAVSDASGYEIWCAKGYDTLEKIKSTSKASCAIADLTDFATYRFAVRPYKLVSGTKYYGALSAEVSKQIMAAPAIISLVQPAAGRSEITWASVQGATEYQVWRKVDSGNYVKIKTITDGTTTYANTKLEKGKTYYYKIRASRKIDTITDISWSPVQKIKIITFKKSAYPETEHSYANGMDKTWKYTISGASAIALKFNSQTSFEANYDKLYITDRQGNAVGNEWYSGSSLAGKVIVVPGNTVNLRLTTNGSGTRYGFSFDYILPAGQ